MNFVIKGNHSFLITSLVWLLENVKLHMWPPASCWKALVRRPLPAVRTRPLHLLTTRCQHFFNGQREADLRLAGFKTSTGGLEPMRNLNGHVIYPRPHSRAEESEFEPRPRSMKFTSDPSSPLKPGDLHQAWDKAEGRDGSSLGYRL